MATRLQGKLSFMEDLKAEAESVRLAQQLRLNVDRLRHTVRNRRILDDSPIRDGARLP
jgi:hypothetical protein